MKLNERKVIARRASRVLKPGQTVNLGIGLPEGVASVAGEEGMLPYITLTTEPGSFGGLPSSGKQFGPSTNASSLIEMNEQFDFYDGGGLDIAFLGAAEISPSGDVNVSRMNSSRLTGPGGFIDITQSTRNICFMSTFTAKGLDIYFNQEEGNISIKKEGTIKKFVNEVYETTFSAAESIRRGQKVYYVTERAVFWRTTAHDVLELIEIAPGIDLQKDILDQMEFTPAISENLKIMDRQFFKKEKMGYSLFGSLAERCTYHEDDHLLFIDLFGISLRNEHEIDWFFVSLNKILHPITKKKGPVDVVVSYQGFDLKSGLEDYYAEELQKLEARHYKSVKRYSGEAFRLAKLRKKSDVKDWKEEEVFNSFDKNKDGVIESDELRYGIIEMFGLRLKQWELEELCKEDITMKSELCVEP